MKNNLVLITASLFLAGCLSTGGSTSSNTPAMYQGPGNLRVGNTQVGTGEIKITGTLFSLTMNVTESSTLSVVDTEIEGMGRKDKTFSPFTATFSGTIQKVENTTFLASEPNEAGLIATCFPSRSGGWLIDVREAAKLAKLKESLKKDFLDYFTLYTFAIDSSFQGDLKQ